VSGRVGRQTGGRSATGQAALQYLRDGMGRHDAEQAAGERQGKQGTSRARKRGRRRGQGKMADARRAGRMGQVCSRLVVLIGNHLGLLLSSPTFNQNGFGVG
jgi:hypothetical protein